MRNTRRSVLAMGAAGVVSAAIVRPAFAGQQDFVNSLISRIRSTLDSSLETDQWPPKYKLVGMNIEDLKKTLEQGGTITSNPVADFGARLDAMLNERREALAYLVSKQGYVAKVRKGQAKATINDIGGEMISRINPKPGWLYVLGSPSSKNAKTIRDDFARLKSIDDVGKKIDDYINNLRPALRDIQARVNALNPLLVAYGKLGAQGFDGIYIGQFDGGGHGRLKLTVKGTAVTGSISGSCTASPCGVDPMVGSFRGTISKDGFVTTALTGTLTDSSGMMKEPIGFHGALKGQVTGNTVSGTWDGKNQYGAPSGTWSASR